jgi:hypothetical protein
MGQVGGDDTDLTHHRASTITECSIHFHITINTEAFRLLDMGQNGISRIWSQFRLSIVNLRVKLGADDTRPVRGMTGFSLRLIFKIREPPSMGFEFSAKLLRGTSPEQAEQALSSPFCESTGFFILLLPLLSLNDVKWCFSSMPEFHHVHTQVLQSGLKGRCGALKRAS